MEMLMVIGSYVTAGESLGPAPTSFEFMHDVVNMLLNSCMLIDGYCHSMQGLLAAPMNN